MPMKVRSQALKQRFKGCASLAAGSFLRKRFMRGSEMGVETARQAIRGGLRKLQGQRAAPACVQFCAGRGPDDGAAETVGDNEAGGERQHLLAEFRRHGEIKMIAEPEILRPFFVRREIGKADLDLDADDRAVAG